MNHQLLSSSLRILALASATCFATCANDREAATSLGADACEHFAEGPIVEATAAVTAADATDVSAEHTRYDLTLSDVGGTRGGFLELTIDDAGDHTFFFDHSVDVVLSGAGGSALTPKFSLSSDADCATVLTEKTYTLGVGTYTMQLSTTHDGILLLVWMGTEHTDE